MFSREISGALYQSGGFRGGMKQQGGLKNRNTPPETPYSLALGPGEDGFKRVAAAAARTTAPRSFVLAATKEKWSSGAGHTGM
jgi:hypothetical protein